MSKAARSFMYAVSVVTALLAMAVPVQADDSPQSPHYRFDEGTLGTSGYLNSSSSNYSATSATGDIAVGESDSTNYQIQDGSKTTSDPTLSFAINTGNINFGSFSATAPTTTTASFSVSDYTSYGYIVQIIGSPPVNGSHIITPLTSTDSSRPGVEQFGINLVANTAPVSLGANPDNGQFGFGTAAPNYATPNQYRFVSGETIAQSPKSSGVTTYTISYLVNVGSLTPGGRYTSNQTLLVTGTY